MAHASDHGYRGDGSHSDDGKVHVHVHPVSFYVNVFLALVTLTVVTVLTAKYVDLDGLFTPEAPAGAASANLVLAMIIATIKASLVCAFFMHLKDDSRFNVLVFVGSLLFVGVFFAYTFNDTEHRHDGDRFHGVHVLPATVTPSEATGTRAPGGVDHQFVFEEPEAGIERTEEFTPHHGGDEHAEGAPVEGEPAAH
jgi:cytochrome c oxidase subunit 4